MVQKAIKLQNDTQRVIKLAIFMLPLSYTDGSCSWRHSARQQSALLHSSPDTPPTCAHEFASTPANQTVSRTSTETVSSRRLRRGARTRTYDGSSWKSNVSVTAITDFQPRFGDNKNLIGAVKGCAVHQSGPRSCLKPIFSAL